MRHPERTGCISKLRLAPGPLIVQTDYRSAGKCFCRSSPPDITASHRPITECRATPLEQPPSASPDTPGPEARSPFESHGTPPPRKRTR